jgi:hypothetical protein
MQAGFGAHVGGVDTGLSIDNVAVEGVFHIGTATRHTPHTFRVGLVVSEE